MDDSYTHLFLMARVAYGNDLEKEFLLIVVIFISYLFVVGSVDYDDGIVRLLL